MAIYAISLPQTPKVTAEQPTYGTLQAACACGWLLSWNKTQLFDLTGTAWERACPAMRRLAP
ncbi:hypothetical protein, partial [Pseudomonas peradeniyensis]